MKAIYKSLPIGLILSMTLGAGKAWAQQSGGGATGIQGFGMFLPLILIFGIFYLMIVRPQQKQAKKRQEMIKALKKGDEVITVGGVHGRIFGVADDILTVEIADNCKVKMDRSGIQSLKGAVEDSGKK